MNETDACAQPLQMAKGRSSDVQCRGITRSGRRCSITSTSPMIDALTGKLVSESLRRGGCYCLYHAVFFCVTDASVSDAIVVFLDFETTGLSVLADHIVEIGVISHCGAVFSTVVRPPVMSMGPSVHGIADAELREGPAFPVAFYYLVRFLEHLSETAVSDGESSADEEAELPKLKGEMPDVLIVAHNGRKFDYAMLLSECYRCSLPLDSLARWKYVDTMDVARAVDTRMFGCLKLQCMLHTAGSAACLRAHRALDDAIALRDVVSHIADTCGVSTLRLLSPFTHEFDIAGSVAQLSSVL